MGKRHVARLIATRLVTTLTLLGAAGAAQATCAEDIVSVRGDFGSVQFTVDVADSIPERSRGLMHVDRMAATKGMLFVYDEPQSVSFWMRNTLIPLDMVFVSEAGTIENIHENAVPLDETPIFGGDDIRYVLEINGGMAARLGLNVGDQMQHTSFPEDAVWPCPIK